MGYGLFAQAVPCVSTQNTTKEMLINSTPYPAANECKSSRKADKQSASPVQGEVARLASAAAPEGLFSFVALSFLSCLQPLRRTRFVRAPAPLAQGSRGLSSALDCFPLPRLSFFVLIFDPSVGFADSSSCAVESNKFVIFIAYGIQYM